MSGKVVAIVIQSALVVAVGYGAYCLLSDKNIALPDLHLKLIPSAFSISQTLQSHEVQPENSEERVPAEASITPTLEKPSETTLSAQTQESTGSGKTAE